MLINVLRDEQPTHIAVAFDKSRADLPARAVRRLQGRAQQDPRRVQQPAAADRGGAQRPPDPLPREGRLRGRRHHRHAGDPGRRPPGRGADPAPATATRSSSSSDDVTVLYPMRGVSELARMTPAAVEEQVRRPAGALPRARGAGGGDLRQPARRPARRAGRGGQVAQRSTTASTTSSPTPTRSPARRVRALRDHLGDVIRNRQLNALVCDLDLELGPQDLAMRPWDRHEVHTLFDGLEFRVLRDRLFETPRVRGGDRRVRASTWPACGSARARSPTGWPTTPAPRASGSGITVQGSWRARHRRGPLASALAAPDGTAAWLDAAELSPDDDAALAAWFADPAAAKVMHDAKGPMLALAARGWELRGLVSDTALAAYLVRPDQRSYDLADLTLRYLRARAQAGGRRRRPADLRRRPATTRAPPRPRCCTPARSSTWPRPSTSESRSTAAPACSPRSSCR